MPHNARHLRDAPIVLPVTLVFVDVHHGIKSVQRTSTSARRLLIIWGRLGPNVRWCVVRTV